MNCLVTNVEEHSETNLKKKYQEHHFCAIGIVMLLFSLFFPIEPILPLVWSMYQHLQRVKVYVLTDIIRLILMSSTEVSIIIRVLTKLFLFEN